MSNRTFKGSRVELRVPIFRKFQSATAELTSELVPKQTVYPQPLMFLRRKHNTIEIQA